MPSSPSFPSPRFSSIACAVPGLIWPVALRAEMLPPLPGLSRLLARAGVRFAAPVSPEEWLAEAFGLQGALPFAALRLAGQHIALPEQAGIPLCADPVALRFAHEHLVLDGPTQIDARVDELDALFASLNHDFADIGHFWHARGEGYLHLKPEHADRLDVRFTPLSSVLGRPVAHFQPSGPQASWWARLANELQISCHNHPVNQAREARGAPALNALWLWGAGMAPAQLVSPAARLRGTDVILRGLAHFAATPLDDDPHASWQWISTLEEAARVRDLGAWLNGLRQLDREVFSPLAEALQAGQRIQLIAPSDTTLAFFDPVSTPRWKFWQGPADSARLARFLSHTSEPSA